MPRRTITMESEIVQAMDEWAKAKGVAKDEAYDRFGLMAVHRHNAVTKYAQAGGAPKAKKAKPAKKAKAKKTGVARKLAKKAAPAAEQAAA